MNRQWMAVMALVIALASALPAAASVGQTQTVQLWHEVQARMEPHRLWLHEQFTEARAQAGDDGSLLAQRLGSRLAMAYPGSSFLGGSGTLKLDDRRNLLFDAAGNLTGLLESADGLVRHYDFRNQSLELSSGRNRVRITLDLEHPERSAFHAATIPAAAAAALNVWMQKRDRQALPNPLALILNDAFAYRLKAVDGQRMDRLGEQLMSDTRKRDAVLAAMAELYRSDRLPLQAAPTPRSLPPAISDDSLIGQVARRLPWPLWQAATAGGGLLLVLALLTWRLRNRRRQARRPKPPEPGERVLFERCETLHTHGERALYEALLQAVDGERYQVDRKVALTDLVRVRTAELAPAERSAFDRIRDRRVDFALLERHDSRVVGVILLDADSAAGARTPADPFVDGVLRQAGIPVLRVPWRRDYPLQQLRQRLTEGFGPVRWGRSTV